MNKEDVILFKENTLKFFDETLKEVFYNRAEYYWDTLPDDEFMASLILNYNYKSEDIEQKKQSFKNKQNAIVWASINKSLKYKQYFKDKFQREIDLLINLLDNNKSIYIAEDNFYLNRNIVKMIKVNQYGIGEVRETPAILFSERKKKESREVFRDIYNYTEKTSYEDLTEKDLTVIKNNILNIFSNSVGAEEVFNPLYEKYFKETFLYFGNNNCLEQLKSLNEENNSDIKFFLESILDNIGNILTERMENLYNLANIDQPNEDFMLFINEEYSKLENEFKRVSLDMPVIGDFLGEYFSLYKYRVLDKMKKELSEEYILKSKSLNIFFEKYNIFDLELNFEFNVRYKNVERVDAGRYMGDKELKSLLSLTNEIFKLQDNEWKIDSVKSKMSLLSDNFLKYAKMNTEKEFMEEIEILKEQVAEVSFFYQDPSEFIKMIACDEEGNMLGLESKSLKIIYQIFWNQKAKIKNITLFELIVEKSEIFTKELLISDLNIAFSNNVDNEMDRWGLNRKLDSIKNLNSESLGVNIIVREKTNNSDTICISFNKTLIIGDDEFYLKIIEKLLRYLWSSDFDNKNWISYIKESILRNKIENMDKIEKDISISRKKV